VSCRSRPKSVRITFRPSAPLQGRLWHFLALVLLLLLFLSGRGAAHAQARAPREAHVEGHGSIIGRVVHAENGSPLGGIQVYLEPVDAARPARGTLSFQASRLAFTDSAGNYALQGLNAGDYRLHIRSPGFRGSSVDVALPDMASARINIELELSPIPMTPVEVIGHPEQPYLRTAAADAGRAGIARIVAVERQANFLESDVRTLTAGDVSAAITLAEPDLFRALQRMPGVSRRDDYTAVLWTRGAPWDHTRVYFDGLPLYNPTHGGWLFSAVNPDGIGEAIFQPGVRSAERGEGAAGILDLRTRVGSTAGVSWRGELSLASAKLSGDGPLPLGGSWMISARRTYVDVLSRAWEVFGGGDEHLAPYDFADVIGRVDVPLFAGITIEASGLYEGDRLRGDIPDLLERNTAAWGNRTGRVSMRVPIRFAVLTATRGGTRFATNVEEADPRPVDSRDGPTLSSLQSSIDHDRLSLRLEGPSNFSRPANWAIGIESVSERLVYNGPFSLTGEGIPGLNVEPVPYDLRLASDYTAAYGQARWGPVQSLQIQLGARVEFGDSVANGGTRRISPRFSARWNPTGSWTISSAWGRSYQYTQAIGASGGPLGPQLHIGNLWILANRGFPALRSEVFTFGTEKWVGGAWLVGLNTYLREVSGVLEPDPTPGPIEPSDNTVQGTNKARGIELSARKLVGDWTMSVGYAYGQSRMRTSQSIAHPVPLRYPGSSDVRHTADLTTGYRFRNGLLVGGAFSYASGVPFTRIVVGDDPRTEEPSANRTPSYRSLDLTLDYATRLGDRDISAYLQLINVLGRRNAVTYAGTEAICPGGTGDQGGCTSPVMVDDFRSGLPRLPLFGFRIAF
jgi:hypothetical protein